MHQFASKHKQHITSNLKQKERSKTQVRVRYPRNEPCQ